MYWLAQQLNLSWVEDQSKPLPEIFPCNQAKKATTNQCTSTTVHGIQTARLAENDRLGCLII